MNHDPEKQNLTCGVQKYLILVDTSLLFLQCFKSHHFPLCNFLFNLSEDFGIPSAHSLVYVDPEAAVSGHDSKSEGLP